MEPEATSGHEWTFAGLPGSFRRRQSGPRRGRAGGECVWPVRGKSNLQTPKHVVPHSHLFKLHLVFLTAALQFLSLRSQAAVIFGVFSLFQWQRYFAIDVFTEFHNYVASKCQLAQLKNVSKREKKNRKEKKNKVRSKITLFFHSFLGFFWPICSNVICINHYSLVLFGFFVRKFGQIQAKITEPKMTLAAWFSL